MRRVLSSATLAGDRQGRTAALIWDRRSIWVITRESYKNHSSVLSRSNSAHLKEGLGMDRCLPIRRRPHQINCSARCPGRLCSLAAQNISLPCRAVPILDVRLVEWIGSALIAKWDRKTKAHERAYLLNLLPEFQAVVFCCPLFLTAFFRKFLLFFSFCFFVCKWSDLFRNGLKMNASAQGLLALALDFHFKN